MKAFYSISMSMLFLFQGITANMEICEQIEKFSHFISHYQMHKEYGGDTFYEYVVEVIFSDQADNKDHHDGSHDDSAPVHSHHQCCHPTVFLTPSNALALKPLLFKERATYSHYSFQFNSRYLESLFQPPRA
jgi:hypothetical protein